MGNIFAAMVIVTSALAETSLLARTTSTRAAVNETENINVTSLSSSLRRRRRDLNDYSSQQYLPAEAPAVADIPLVDQTTFFADDGYHYKTARQIRYRNRSRRSAHKPAHSQAETSSNDQSSDQSSSWMEFETTATKATTSKPYHSNSHHH